MPEPVGATQKVALDAIWELLLRSGRWPTFQELDQHLYRAHDLDAARLLPEMPQGLLHGVDTGSSMPIAGTTTIGLTAAGAGATGRAQRELGLFLTVVRHAVALERGFEPPADQPDMQPGLVPADVVTLLKLALPEDAALLKRLSAILYTERWGWTSFGGQGTDAWEVRIGREVRAFRDVQDIATYWDLRPKHWTADESTSTAIRPLAPSPPTRVFLQQGTEYGSANGQQGAAIHAARDMAVNHYGGSMDRVDVLVIAALPEEFDGAKAAGLAFAPASPGIQQWEEHNLDGVPTFLWGEYRVDGKASFTVALARPTQMGGRATGPFAASLADRLCAASLAMCGVCAGNPAVTALGDVVVGEPVYEWDEGKQSASGFVGDHRQFRLLPPWLRVAQDFDASRVASYGDATDDEALLWFLEQLHRGQQPRAHPARDAYFPSGTWRRRLAQLEEQGLIHREPTGEAVLTGGGSNLVQRRLYDDAEGPQRLPFRVLAAPMASGSAVVADPDVWARLKAMGMRNITAVEMEAATIATVAHDRGLPWLVAKGVMDHADTRKDDRYKRFAARASAQVMFALLEHLMTKVNAGGQRITERGGTAKISGASGRPIREKLGDQGGDHAVSDVRTVSAVIFAKRCLSDANTSVELHDLLRKQVEQVRSLPPIVSTVFSVPHVAAEHNRRLDEVETGIETLAALVATCAYWGAEHTDRWWFDDIGRFAELQAASGATALINLTAAPAVYLLYAAGVSAVACGRWPLVGRLLSRPTATDMFSGARRTVASLFSPSDVLFVDRASLHLHDFLSPLFVDYLSIGSTAFVEAWERWEYLRLVACTDDFLANNGRIRGSDVPHIRAIDTPGREYRPVPSDWLQGEVDRLEDGHPMLLAGFCGGSSHRLRAAQRAYDERFAHFAQDAAWSAVPKGGGMLPSGMWFPDATPGIAAR